ncbi:MAG: SDR family oxidoreductase [Epulopiscium sp. Nuni2H_MBin001]|nr:MAG: SDR family oxidoreductase [Epulopiscium sp. Nuni2H_MBin001]
MVTGANSGVGLETTRQLIKQGATVIMACRRVDAGKQVAESFSNLKGKASVLKLDLSDLNSVRTFVKEFLSKYDKLDGIDCNAGAVIMGTKAIYTVDDLEMTMAISYFGHFLLVELLLDILKQSIDGRIVMLSSCVHAGNEKNRPYVHFDDMNYKLRKYNAMNAYCEAKVASVLYVVELANRLKDTNVTAYSVHPGWARSNFGKGNTFMRVLSPVMAPFIRSMTDSNEESAQTSLYCLISDEACRYSGSFFSQSSVLYSDKYCKDGGWPLKSPNPNATDEKKANELVKLTYKIVGL